MRQFASAILLALSAAVPAQQMDCPPGAANPRWQSAATGADRERLREWRTAFTQGLAQASAAGHGADIEREGALLVPDAAIGGPIPNGNYQCGVIKVGAKSAGLLDYVSYPPFRCRISQQAQAQHFDKLTGSQRHHGTIYAADQLRSAFLGTMVLGDETRAYQYGRDPQRDLAGWVERIGDNRWRLILPYPHYESTIDVIELIPE